MTEQASNRGIRSTDDMPLIHELAEDAVQQLRRERKNFTLTTEQVLAFLDVERKKEDERQVRELMKQRPGRLYGLFPELRELLKRFVSEGGE